MSCSRGLFGAAGVAVLALGLVGTSWAFSMRYAMYGRARVVRVESPNLLIVKMLDRGSIVPIRLLGVGSPLNRDRIKHLSPEIFLYIRKNDLWKISREYVQSLLKKRVVEVWDRKWDRFDDKHRLLAYILIPNRANAPLDLNGEIIRNGLGFVTRDYVHVTFATYRHFEENAKKNHRGIWKGLSMSRLSSLKQ